MVVGCHKSYLAISYKRKENKQFRQIFKLGKGSVMKKMVLCLVSKARNSSNKPLAYGIRCELPMKQHNHDSLGEVTILKSCPIVYYSVSEILH